MLLHNVHVWGKNHALAAWPATETVAAGLAVLGTQPPFQHGQPRRTASIKSGAVESCSAPRARPKRGVADPKPRRAGQGCISLVNRVIKPRT